MVIVHSNNYVTISNTIISLMCIYIYIEREREIYTHTHMRAARVLPRAAAEEPGGPLRATRRRQFNSGSSAVWTLWFYRSRTEGAPS